MFWDKKNYNKIKIFAILLLALNFASCRDEGNNQDEENIKIIFISEAIENRKDGWMENSLHDKNCIGFLKTHFNPKFIEAGYINNSDSSGRIRLEQLTNLKWNVIQTKNKMIDFNKYFNHDTTELNPEIKNKAVYVLESYPSDKDQEGYLSIGSDDGFSLWVNGDSLLTVHKGRSLTADEDIIPIRLKKGDNIFMYKIEQGYGAWKLYRRLLNRTKYLELLKSSAEEKMYYDLPESCIIADNSNFITLKKNSNTKYDSLNTIEIRWKNLDSIISFYKIPAYKLSDTINLPVSFDGFALFEIVVKDKKGFVAANDLVPIYSESKANGLVNKYCSIKEIPNDPYYIAKINAIKKMFIGEKKASETGLEFSSRLKAQALFDLYSYIFLKNQAHINFMGPKTFGYFSDLSKSVEPYKVFIPPSINKSSKIKVCFFIRYIIKDSLDFWDTQLMSSHFFTTHRISLSSHHNTIFVIPYGGGNKNFRENYHEEINIIWKELCRIFPVDTSGISILSLSNGSKITYELLSKLNIPVSYLGHISPVMDIDQDKIIQIYENIKIKYPDLKMFIRHGLDDTDVPIEHARRFKEIVKAYFPLDYKEVEGSTHWSYLYDPETEFLKFINKK